MKGRDFAVVIAGTDGRSTALHSGERGPETVRPPGGDIAIERQDQIVVAEDGTPWVRTDCAVDVPDDDIRRHRAPRSVFEDLEEEGMSGPEAEGPRGPGVAGASAWWALPGLGVGFAAGCGGAVLIRRAAARPDAGPQPEEPRQVLIDL
ncbi:hypothetical protein ABT373_05690 [Streptomyces sp. NPDC000070]|uniref:hypothetical protein n=1 Tax=Streptomyces sp. NPDC000070 TaxID=3154240 RepID=UPI00331BE024